MRDVQQCTPFPVLSPPRQLTWPGQVWKDLVLLPGCTNPTLCLLKWTNTAAGPHCSDATPCRDHPGGWWTSGVTSKASSTAGSDQLFLNREGHPLPPPSPEHKSSTQMGNSAAVTRISNCNSNPQALLEDGWQKRCSLQSSAVCLQELPPAHLCMTADVKSLRNTDPTVTCILRVSAPA